MATAPADAQMVSATARYVRMSARKARLVADLVRGKPVPEALGILKFSTRAAAKPLAKTLRSAMANAEHNGGLDADDLRLAVVMVDEGPTIRRFRPRAMGRATRIRKRTCHITIGLAPTPVSGRRGGRR